MGSYYATGAPLVTSTIETKQFGDIELLGTFFDYVRAGKNYWARVGDGGSIIGGPIVHNNAIYFGACDHIFYAVSPEGHELWRFETRGRIQEHACAFDSTVAFGSWENSLYALDATTGELRWKFVASGPFGNKPTCHAGVLYSGCEDGNLYAIDALTGKVRWRFKSLRSLSTGPLVYHDRVFIGYEDYNFYCLTLKGRLVWKFPTQGTVVAWPAVALGNTVYFGSLDNTLYAVDIPTGRLRWKFKFSTTVNSPSLWSNRIYVGSSDSNLYCIDAETGNLLWRFKTRGAVSLSSFHNGNVYFGSYDNNLYCADATTGELRWTFKTNGFVVRGPAFLPGSMVFGSWDCNLYCLDYNGRLLWKFPTSISTPSPIEPPEAAPIESVKAIWQVEETKPQEKYKARGAGGSYASFTTYIQPTSYVSGSREYTGRKRQR